MDVQQAILERRAYRALAKVEITEQIVKDLAECALLAPSCYNNQPWRYVFVYDPAILKRLHSALSKGNTWATTAAMIIGVCSRKDLDCVVKDREYYLFDTGMATAFLILRATELGLVAHPIAGFDQEKTKEILHIPEDMKLITLVIVGKHSDSMTPLLSDKQIEIERTRPERFPLERFAFIDTFKGE